MVAYVYQIFHYPNIMTYCTRIRGRERERVNESEGERVNERERERE